MHTTPYDSRWRKIRAQILERDNHTCTIGAPNCTTIATEVDHIVALRDGGARLDPTNLRASCKQCNVARANTQRARLADLARRGRDAAPPSRGW
jgi:5-methylcytosine-specific restriction endonuclease McrA